MSGIGLSLGAGVLALYHAKKGERAKLDSSVGVSCHFDPVIANEFMQTNFFGLYDMAVGKSFASYARTYYTKFDELAAKKHPERVLGDTASKIVFGSEIYKVFAKSAGKSVEQYTKDSHVTRHLHLIKKPFFFISTLDDPFFGSKVIPIGQCHDNILLGVLKHGGHCCNIEGGILPTGQWWTKPSMVFMDHFMKEAVANA